ncbi:NAD(P)H azoreductase [Pigmentiphaga humi]|uniref:NAD(P)H azoreductase n=1 Tax=Pigmentiphaga humi TaxID=2478468 RepID=A0A3P4B1Q6_9BURK|nr:NAD(P)H-binding protein [Pigmentiphaga humi]VCU69811.1 NAD(P)H azoreductase [Pigmentiphaga humi]
MILVTGASGNIGRCVVRQLVEAGERVRALVRDPSSAAFPPGVQACAGDLAEPAGLAQAFDGVERMFLFTPASGCGSVASAARAAGVRRAVLLSSAATQKADPRVNPIAARHDAAEKAVQAAGLAWTFLRPDSFAANALAWAAGIRAQSEVRGAYPQAQRNPIHEEDVAAVAVAALLGSGHEQAAYLLTGPAIITQAGQAEAIGQAIGRPVRFVELTRECALEEMAAHTPRPVAEKLLDYAAKSVHVPPLVTSAVEDVTGRPARSFARWAQDHAADFR